MTNNNIKIILDLCKRLNKYAHRLTLEDLQNDEACQAIPDLSLDTVKNVINEVKNRLKRGCKRYENEVIFHTGPHHDDIMLGIMPFINRQLRSKSNDISFGVMTSGFHSVTNEFLLNALKDTLRFIEEERMLMIHYADFFTCGYKLKYDKDIHHFLDNVANRNYDETRRGLCHRITRDMVGIWGIKSIEELKDTLVKEISFLESFTEETRNNPDPDIQSSIRNCQSLKGQIREFEEELVWAYMGVSVDHVHHLHLGLYNRKSEFTEPDYETDVFPVLDHLRYINPTVISVVMDAGNIRPDTHHKVLLSIAAAVEKWSQETDVSDVRIIGFRNVWSTFDPSTANTYVPVSLNSFAVFEKAFSTSYLTQVVAEFPNPDFDGPFSELAESIWVKQLRDVQLLLGKDYFYENESALVRATHGLIFLNEMNVPDFLRIIKEKYAI